MPSSRPVWQPMNNNTSKNYVRPGPRPVLPEAERIRSEAAMKALAEDLRMFQIKERSEFIVMPKFKKQEKAMMKWMAVGKGPIPPPRE
ncbi:hypothetical protein THAR02_02237 [Trichoderma harzianum]|uniref:Uncharacterized protein n=1 Tax=Trichoderma harzianum TaxID=5544 RepID=A0A0F9Y0P5_TRIHA|nr:hypothetical protein THAR02_02237 [Trichoderma harzianum]